MAKKVILDVDTGSDDAVAIMTALLSDDIDLLGVTVTHGNQALVYTLENTLRVMGYMGATVPVFKGCSEPLVKNLTPGRELSGGFIDDPNMIVDGKEVSLHEKNMGLPPTDLKAQPIPAPAWIVETLKNSSEKITLIPVGPCTNIAMALRLDPSIVSNIEEIVVMGGGDNMGNRTASSEFNFFADPEAAKIVVNCGAKVTIVGLNATHSAKFSYADADRFTALGTKAGIFTGRLIRHRIDFEYLQGQGSEEGTAVHDALTVCAVIDRSILSDVQPKVCDVDIGGKLCDGMLLCDTRPLAKREHPTYVAYKVDKEKVLNLLLTLMAKEL